MTQHFTPQQLIDMRQAVLNGTLTLSLEDCKKIVEQKRAQRFNARAAQELAGKGKRKTSKGMTDAEFDSTLNRLLGTESDEDADADSDASESGNSTSGGLLSDLVG